ncbi:Hypothetical predicted protein, partial [Paramuricea clavata]
FVIRKHSKTIYEQSRNESSESDILLASSNVDYAPEAGVSLSCETSEAEDFEEDVGTGSCSSQNTEVTEQLKKKVAKKKCGRKLEAEVPLVILRE